MEIEDGALRLGWYAESSPESCTVRTLWTMWTLRTCTQVSVRTTDSRIRRPSIGLSLDVHVSSPFLGRTCELAFPTARVRVGLVFLRPSVSALMPLSHNEPSQRYLTRRLTPAPQCIWGVGCTFNECTILATVVCSNFMQPRGLSSHRS